ncbi:LCP family protein [Kitasatospora aureofaciens]|uniref:LCP family protein n=1 Tax=Kitasatospora aureofaciens TaxID=1894 RepID=UPI0027E0E9F4|nr:LCP family protein [Kitasatospora aureofaciens]
MGHTSGRRGRKRRGGGSEADRISPLTVAGRAVACAAGGSVMAVSGFSWYTYHDLTDGMTTSDALKAVQAPGASAPPHLDKAVNLLLIGLDSRKDQDGKDLPDDFVKNELHAGNSGIGAYETNTLILMHIPADGGKVEAFSIPRDDLVDLVNVPGGHPLGRNKIKEAYNQAKYYAEQKLSKQYSGAELEHRGRDAGRAATLLTVQKFLNVPIDHFAELNLKGFYDVARALGPITVCLKHDTSDPTHGRTASDPGAGGGSGFVGHQGLNTLDPAMALAFVRQRHHLDDPSNEGDFARTHRQQAFIAAVTNKLKQEGVLGDLGRMRGLLDAVKQDVVIDSSWDILDFAQQATNLTGGNVEFNTLPMEHYGDDPVAGAVNIVDVAKIQAIVRQTIGVAPAAAPAAGAASPSAAPSSSSSPSIAPATVDVQGTTAAKADEAAKDLTALGYTAGQASAGTTRHSKTTVVYGAGAKDAAQQIATHLNVASTTASSGVQAGHVLVTLGADYVPPATAAPSTPPATDSATAPGSGTPSASTADQYAGPAVIGGNTCVD